MNSIINSIYFRRAGTFCAGCALTFGAFCGGSMTALAGEQHNIIANKIMQLQQSSQRWIEIDLSRQRYISFPSYLPLS